KGRLLRARDGFAQAVRARRGQRVRVTKRTGRLITRVEGATLLAVAQVSPDRARWRRGAACPVKTGAPDRTGVVVIRTQDASPSNGSRRVTRRCRRALGRRNARGRQ